MKKTHANLKPERISELFDVFTRLNTKEDFEKFFADLCTSNELHAMADRWYIAKEIQDGVSHFDISAQGKISFTTITRVSRCLKNGAGYKSVLHQNPKDGE